MFVLKVLKPGGMVLFRDYGLNDHAMLRFKAGSKLGENFYVRQDGTRSFFFSKGQDCRIYDSSSLDLKIQKHWSLFCVFISQSFWPSSSRIQVSCASPTITSWEKRWTKRKDWVFLEFFCRVNSSDLNNHRAPDHAFTPANTKLLPQNFQLTLLLQKQSFLKDVREFVIKLKGKDKVFTRFWAGISSKVFISQWSSN